MVRVGDVVTSVVPPFVVSVTFSFEDRTVLYGPRREAEGNHYAVSTHRHRDLVGVIRGYR